MKNIVSEWRKKDEVPSGNSEENLISFNAQSIKKTERERERERIWIGRQRLRVRVKQKIIEFFVSRFKSKN